MDMICLHVESAYRPSIGFTDATNFLFEKRCKLPDQNLFTVFGAPDKVIGQFIHDVFGVLRIHTPTYNVCSNSLEELRWAALPLDES